MDERDPLGRGVIVPTYTYHHPDGGVDELVVEPGVSVMRAAVNNGVEGIVGECGGQMMCATCHVYVRGGCDALAPISDDEDEMLEATSEPRDPGKSRLSCQLSFSDPDARLEVDVPGRWG